MRRSDDRRPEIATKPRGPAGPPAAGKAAGARPRRAPAPDTRQAIAHPAIFTIVSANYIGYAATLMQSVREFHPDAARFIVLADTGRVFPDTDLAAELLPCDALGIALIENMKLWYSIMEFNTAIKPSVFLQLFARGFGEVVYLDPDIVLFAPLAEVFAALEAHTLVLTPHMMQPLQDGHEPSDLTIMRSGVYNLGFLAMRNDDEGRRFARWWAERCFAHCRVDVPGNMFTDQRWMDLAPVFVSKPFILRHPGYNVAYWNIVHRQVERRGDAWLVDGGMLVFFHFSGIEPDKPTVFSKHQNRFPDSASLPAPVAMLCDEYRRRVAANRWAATRGLPYGFGAFANGRPIEDFMRRWILRAIDDGRIDPHRPLEIDSEFFDAEDEVAAERGAVMTRFMYQFWLDREDLRRVFDVYDATGLENYIAWFLGGDGEAQGIDGRSIAAAMMLYDSDESQQVKPQHRPHPWPSVAAASWDGPAAEVENFLRGDLEVSLGGVETLLPRQAALAWELRLDLRSYFPVADLEGLQEYLAWALTSGALERSFDPGLLTDRFIAHLAGLSNISSYFRDVPLTEGMMLTRKIPLRRDYLDGWLQFPTERKARLAHGLWYAFVAVKAYHWPSAMTAPVRRYFEEPGEIDCGGLRLSRGAEALRELRVDLQRLFPLKHANGHWSFLSWITTDGLRELGLTLDEFDPRLRGFLGQVSPRFPGVPQALEMVHAARVDLQNAFDLSTEAGRAGLLHWGDHHFTPTYLDTPLAAAYPPRPAAALTAEALPEPHRAPVGLTGQWSAASGRGEDVRCTARSLLAAGYDDFLIIDRDSGAVLRPDGAALPAGPVELEANIVHLNADTAYDDWQFLKRQGVASRRSIGYWAWELDSLPRRWLHAYSFYDEIWAATEFARAAFARAALRPVTLLPLAVVPPEVMVHADRARLGLPEDATVFFFMFDFRSYATRKNPEAVVQAFLRAFPRGDEPVRLLIKTQGGAAAALPWRRLNALCHDRRIEIRDVALERADLLALIDSADAFVSLHRSEGFGRGPAEAMLMGKPVILTDYSGTRDFASADCAYPVRYALRPVADDEYP
ncbi:MAG: glycosyltransferase, partial [Acidisphaera sp.]|nr:glycosyltransferase [Acidisphaera sp.]